MDRRTYAILIVIGALLWAHAAVQAGEVVRVATATQLQEALEGGVAHVHVTEHLDLRGLRVTAIPAVDASGELAGELGHLVPGLVKLQSRTVRNPALPARLDPRQLQAGAHGVAALQWEMLQ